VHGRLVDLQPSLRGQAAELHSRPCWKPRPKCQAAPATAPVITPPKTKPPGGDAGRLAGGQV